MKLHTKLLLGFGSLWAVLLSSTFLVLVLLKEQSTSLEDAFRTNFSSVDYCNQMVIALDSYNQLALISIWTHTKPPAEAISKTSLEFERGADGQRHNITLPGEPELTATAFERSAEFQRSFTALCSTDDNQLSHFYQSNVFPRYIEARTAVRAVVDLNIAHLRDVNASLQRNLSAARIVQLLFALVGAGSAIVSVIILRKTIVGPLHSLTGSVRQVEAGNLDLAVPVRTKDELGDLAVAFNAMAAKLREYRQSDNARLHRTQQTTQLAIDSLPDAVAVFNAQGHVEISNFQARKHFGLSADANGSAQLPAWLGELVASTLASGRPVEPQGYHSAVQLFENGTERFMLPRAVPMFAENGAIIGVVVILVDVTRLWKADEVKSCLVSTVSHELKTPLAGARFSAHLLAQETVGPLDERQRHLVQAACEGTDRLHRIIEDLLQFQRFEEGRQSVRMVPAEPGKIVARAANELRDEFARQGLELTVHITSDLPLVRADPDLVNHVLTNLLSNTLKFVPRGGHVCVVANLQRESICFSVSDDGPGIPVEHQGKLFSRFYRAAAPPGTAGAGLGLSIARQLVEAQGGTISYECSPKGGARFSFLLHLDQSTIQSQCPNPVT
jgi:signal transduction histidine kinase